MGNAEGGMSGPASYRERTSTVNSAFPIPHSASDRCPVALLELLAAAAGAWVVAADPGVGVGNWRARGGLRRRSRVAPDQPVSLRLRCHHGGGAPRTADRPGTRPPHAWAADVARGRAELDLQLEPALGEGGMHVPHQPDEHVVAFRLVLYQRVFLAPGAVLYRRLELVQIVPVILPLLVYPRQLD